MDYIRENRSITTLPIGEVSNQPFREYWGACVHAKSKDCDRMQYPHEKSSITHSIRSRGRGVNTSYSIAYRTETPNKKPHRARNHATESEDS